MGSRGARIALQQLECCGFEEIEWTATVADEVNCGNFPSKLTPTKKGSIFYFALTTRAMLKSDRAEIDERFEKLKYLTMAIRAHVHALYIETRPGPSSSQGKTELSQCASRLVTSKPSVTWRWSHHQSRCRDSDKS